MAENDQPFVELLDRYFDGQLAPDEKRALEARLRSDAAARRLFWEMAQLHAALHAWGGEYSGRQEAGFATAAGEPAKQPVGHASVIKWVAWTFAAAAVIVLGIIGLGRKASEAASPLAVVSFQRNTAWATGQTLGVGEYTLARGAVRFETTEGASVSVAAPARFQLTDAKRIVLSEGRLTARMLHKGATLTVRAGGLEVTDLGTAFGVEAREGRRALVSVFDGQVAVNAPAAGAEMRLGRGESLLHDGASNARTQYDPAAFRDLWPLTAGIDEASKLVEFLPPGPLLRPLREYRANDHVFLFPEKQNATADRALSIDLARDVTTWPDAPASPYPLRRGERVSSYLVFFQPDPSERGLVRHLAGEITFQRRVVGVICSDQGLDASDPAVGATEADYATPGQRRGLEEADKENYRGSRLPHDSITIAPDGRTVRFDFYVADEREQMRVLVAPN